MCVTGRLDVDGASIASCDAPLSGGSLHMVPSPTVPQCPLSRDLKEAARDLLACHRLDRLRAAVSSSQSPLSNDALSVAPLNRRVARAAAGARGRTYLRANDLTQPVRRRIETRVHVAREHEPARLVDDYAPHLGRIRQRSALRRLHRVVAGGTK